MIARGMLDELRHNALGNEVTLTKRFRRRNPRPGTPGAGGERVGIGCLTEPGVDHPMNASARPTILVVDDEPEVLRSLHDLLRGITGC